MHAVWYRREVTIPAEWAGASVLLHFQAVDYDATVWVNGEEAGRHRGGFTPFTVDLRGFAAPGETVVIVVRARDEQPRRRSRAASSPRNYAPYSCFYTRTTGIWQTVWMEPVPDVALRRPRLTPDVANGMIRLEQPLTNNRPGLRLRAVREGCAGRDRDAACRADLDLAPAPRPADSARTRPALVARRSAPL